MHLDPLRTVRIADAAVPSSAVAHVAPLTTAIHVRIGTLPFPARGTRVLVDGHEVLRGPGTIELTAGAHPIELRDENDAVLCRDTLRVSPDDADRAEPPRWTPPASCTP